MRICHIAPFAPNRCGLYESARDMARADIMGGNEVVFIDAGIVKDGVQEPQKFGEVDDRAGFRLVSANNDMINTSDVLIMHTGFSDSWIVRSQIPIIWVVHGRPLACFKPENAGKGNSYSLYRTVSLWPRSKKMLYFWPEFRPYWEGVFPDEKHLVFKYPVVDETRFKVTNKIDIKSRGKYNIVICDTNRDDIDNFELVNGLVEAVKQIKGLKIHFCGLEFPLTNAWNILLGKLKAVNGLGDCYERLKNMENIYNTFDCLISPNRIITRTICEALCCGLPVINQNNQNNIVCDYTCDMADTKDVVEAVKLFVYDFDNGKINKQKIIERSKVFNMKPFSNTMNEVYKKIIYKG
jgi:hypothetical protein